MPARLLRSEELAALDAFPAELSEVEVGAHYTLDAADLALVRSRRRADNRLGLALQLCALRHLGFFPEDLAGAPAPAVSWLASQVGADPADLAGYGGRYKTVLDHRGEAVAHAGYRTVGSGDLKRLGDWLTERALEHDRARFLLELALGWLQGERIVRPGLSVVERAVVAARARALDELARRLSAVTAASSEVLDALLVVDATIGRTRLSWLDEGATATSPTAIGAQLDKLAFLRAMGTDGWDLSGLNPNRRHQLADEVRRRTNQALARMRPERRWPALVAFCHDRTVELVDEVVDLADQSIGRLHSRSSHALDDLKRANSRAANDKVVLFTRLARLVLDDAIPPDALRAAILAEIPAERLAAAIEEAESLARPPDDNYFDLLAHRYSQLRTWAPAWLGALDLRAGPGAEELLDAVQVLRDLNRSGRRAVPEDAPTAFVPRSWRPYVSRPEGKTDRHYWEMCLLTQLRQALRSGDVWVAGSRRHADPATYLIPPEAWGKDRGDAYGLLGLRPDPAERLALMRAEFRDGMAKLDDALARGAEVRVEEGRLVVTPIEAEDQPEGLDSLERAITDRLPRVSLTDVLIEVDGWSHFLDCLTHASGATARSADIDIHRLAAVLALATNIGLGPMADAAKLSYERLAWAAEWYLRTDTLEAATSAILSHQLDQPITRSWERDLSRSSSDAQRFTVPVASTTTRWLPRYFGLRHRGLSVYTWTSDRWAQFATRVISSSIREATVVLDGILDNALEFRPEEHSTDTAGWTDVIFALFDLLGMQFAPRLRDVGDLKLYRLGETGGFPNAGPLLTGKADLDLVARHWDDLARIAASLNQGWVTASLLVAKLQAQPRQSTITRALVEHGRAVRTLFLLRYLPDPAYRREITRQLNKGEAFHALRQRIFFGLHGKIRRADPDAQADQANALNLVTAAVTCWNTVYLAEVVDQLRREGWDITAEQLAHVSPTEWHHINPYGDYRFDLNPPTGRRPLRTGTPTSTPQRPPRSPSPKGATDGL